MRIARFVLFVMLSFAIPLAGYAGLGVPKMPCPMEAAAMAEMQAESGMDQQVKVADCCNDMATMFRTGKTCKVGQECKIGTMGVSVFAPKPADKFGQLGVIALPKDRVLKSLSVNIWRPPA